MIFGRRATARLLSVLFIALPEVAFAQNYVHSSRVEPFVPLASLPGITGVTQLVFNGSDDAQVTAPIGFNFNFLGTSHTQVNLSTNGYITFGSEFATSFSNVAMGSAAAPNSFIAPFWDDLGHSTLTGALYGTIGTAPNRIFVIQGGPASQLGAVSGDLIYQIWLYEGAAQRFDYRIHGTSLNLTGSIGYEGAGGQPFFSPLTCSPNCTEANLTGIQDTMYTTMFAVDPELTGFIAIPARGALPGTTVTGPVSLFNQAQMVAPGVLATLYLSQDNILDATDVIVGAVGPVDVPGGAQTVTVTATVNVPTSQLPGDYVLILEIDSADDFIENNELDNVVPRPARFATAHEFHPTAFEAPGIRGANPGETVPFSLTLANAGVPFTGDTRAKLFVSSDNMLDAADLLFGETTVRLSGAPSEVLAFSLTAPQMAAASYFMIVEVEAAHAVIEVDETNNALPATAPFATGPDVSISSILPPPLMTPGVAANITTRIEASGAPFSGEVAYQLWASADTLFDVTDTLIGDGSATFSRQASVDDTRLFTLPSSLAAGGYYVIGVVDPLNVLSEVTETNNNTSSLTTVANATDLVPMDGGMTVSPAIAGAGDMLSVSGAISTVGLTYSGVVPYRLFLTTDDLLDFQDPVVFDGTVTFSGQAWTAYSATFPVPATAAIASHAVYVVVDPDNTIPELIETNNGLVSVPRVSVVGADLRVSTVTGSSRGFFGSAFPITMVIENVGDRPAGTFRYAYYLSDNDIIRVTDQEVWSSTTAPIAAGASRTFTDFITLPTWATTQTKFIGVIVDVDSQIAEELEVNNIGRLPTAVTIEAPIPDLRIDLVQVPVTGAAGEPLAITRSLTNIGVADANAFSYSYYLSLDTTIDETDLLVATEMGSLSAGGEDYNIDIITLPGDVAPGLYHLGAWIDPASLLVEIEETNNFAIAMPIRVYNPELRIVTETLPPASDRTHYEAGLYAEGGASRITWSISRGALPTGLALDGNTGIVRGVPSGLGLFDFTVRATAGTAFAERGFSIRVALPSLTITVETMTLPPALLGHAYTGRVVATGGVPPYQWSALTAMPSGLALDIDGRVTGTPTVAGDQRVMLRAVDVAGAEAVREVTMHVVDPSQTVLVQAADLPRATVGFDYCGSDTIRIFATGGAAPYTWSSADVPPGLTLAADGSLCGIPTRAGSFAFTARAEDSAGVADTARLVLEVEGGRELAVSTLELPRGKVGEEYSMELKAVRGDRPFRWGTVSLAGELPEGITLSAEGMLSGVPTTGGVYAFVVQVTDAADRVAEHAFAIDVEGLPMVDDKGCGCSATEERGTSAWSFGFLLVGALSLRRRRRALAAVGLVACLVGASSSAYAQAQVPGTPYVRFQTPVTYADVAATALSFPTGLDEGEAQVTLPFPFKFYDTTYTQIVVGTNAAIVFGATGEISLSNEAPGSGGFLNNFLAPFWDDMYLFGGQIGTLLEGTAPNRVFIIEFRNVAAYMDTSATFNAQVRLHEGAAGHFDLDYGTVSNNSVWGATMGMEDSTGARPILFASSGCTSYCTSADLSPLTNTRLTFLQDPGVEVVAGTITGPEVATLGTPFPVSVTLSSLHGQRIGPFNIGVVAANNANLVGAETIHTSQVTLEPFETRTFVVEATAPVRLGPGRVLLGLQVDPTATLPEFNENNNTAVSDTMVRLREAQPDLTVSGVRVLSRTATAGDMLSVRFTPTNRGGVDATSTFAVKLSANPFISSADAELSRVSYDLTANSERDDELEVMLPRDLQAGVYWVGVFADPDNLIAEVEESNNGVAMDDSIVIFGGQLGIVTRELPLAQIDVPYAARLIASGGAVARTWTVTSGTLPVGLVLDASGEILGQPIATGMSTFIVSVSSRQEVATQMLTLIVSRPDEPLTVVTRDVPPPVAGDEYSYQLMSTGSDQPLTWTASDVPEGLTVRADGWLSGIPARPGIWMTQISATDGVELATADLIVEVLADGRVSIVTNVLPRAVLDQAYDVSLTASGGTAPLKYSVTAGTLPQGLVLSTDGRLHGTIRESRTTPFRFVVEVRDSAAFVYQSVDSNLFELFVDSESDFQIVASAMPDAFLGVAYDAEVSAMGGQAPYAWTFEGQVPEGLVATTDPASGNLRILGQPKVEGLATLVVRANDAAGRRATRAVAIRVLATQIAKTDPGGCSSTGASDSHGAVNLFAAVAAIALIQRLRRRSSVTSSSASRGTSSDSTAA